MVFVPVTREEWSSRKGEIMHELHELTEDAPITTLLQLISQQIGGWPMYLLTNVTGHNNHLHQREGRGLKIGQDGSAKKNGWFDGVNHFDPRSPLYEAKDAEADCVERSRYRTRGHCSVRDCSELRLE